MKSYKITGLLIALFVISWGSTQAQYDDLYYDPDTDGTYYDYSTTDNTNNNETYAYEDE